MEKFIQFDRTETYLCVILLLLLITVFISAFLLCNVLQYHSESEVIYYTYQNDRLVLYENRTDHVAVKDFLVIIDR